MTESSSPHYGPGGRAFYGAVTVGERGQVVIPAQARRDHGISAGEKLLVLGSPEGLALVKIESLLGSLQGSAGLLAQLQGMQERGDRAEEA